MTLVADRAGGFTSWILVAIVMALAIPAAEATPVYGFNGVGTECSGSLQQDTYLYTGVWPPSVLSPFNFTFNYLTAGVVRFSFVAYYLPTNSRYIIDFGTQFEEPASSITQLGSCTNVNTQTYASLPFSEWWTHLPSSIGIGSATAPNDTACVQNGYWTAASDGCALVQFTGTIPLSDLIACPTSAVDSTPEVSATTVGFQTDVMGTLYVYLAAPISPGGTETEGYSFSRWDVPFSLSLNTLSEASFDDFGIVLSFIVASSYIDVQTKNLIMNVELTISMQSDTVRLQLQSIAAYLAGGESVNFQMVGGQYLYAGFTNATSYSSTGTYTLNFQAEPVDPSTFNYNYNGNYDATFGVTSCTGGTCTSVGVVPMSQSINMAEISSSGESEEISYQTSLETGEMLLSFVELPLPDPLQAPTNTALLDSVVGLPADELSDLNLQIYDVYICQDTDATPFAYDGVENFGCVNQTVSVTLASGGAIVSNPVLAGYYGASLTAQYLPSYQMALLLTIEPQIIDAVTGDPFEQTNRPIYLQIDSLVTLESSQTKRSLPTAPSKAASETILPGSRKDVYPPQTPSSKYPPSYSPHKGTHGASHLKSDPKAHTVISPPHHTKNPRWPRSLLAAGGNGQQGSSSYITFQFAQNSANTTGSGSTTGGSGDGASSEGGGGWWDGSSTGHQAGGHSRTHLSSGAWAGIGIAIAVVVIVVICVMVSAISSATPKKTVIVERKKRRERV